MATILESIGTGGDRDRSTIVLWDSNDGGGDGLGNDDCTGECYDDSVFDETFTINFSANSVVLSVASAERHDGTAGNGARVVRTGAGTVLKSEVEMTFEWLELDVNGQTANPYTIEIKTTGEACTVKNIIAHDAVTTFSFSSLLTLNARNVTSLLLNSIIYDLAGTNTNVSGVEANTHNDSASKVFNTTIHNISAVGAICFGYTGSTQANRDVQNVIATDTTAGTTAKDHGGVAGTESHNLSSDATASGTGSLINKTAADQYISTTGGSEDFHLKATADAVDAGVDKGTTPSGVQFDIDNRDRDAEGDTWDMGADEFVSVVSFIPYPNPRYALTGGMQPMSGGV